MRWGLGVASANDEAQESGQKRMRAVHGASFLCLGLCLPPSFSLPSEPLLALPFSFGDFPGSSGRVFWAAGRATGAGARGVSTIPVGLTSTIVLRTGTTYLAITRLMSALVTAK